MIIDNKKTIEIYSVLDKINEASKPEVSKGKIILTGSASLYTLGLHEAGPNDLDFAYISAHFYNDVRFTRSIKRSDGKLLTVSEIDLDEYSGDIGSLVQVYINSVKVDLFFHCEEQKIVSHIGGIIPVMCPVETYKQKFKTNKQKAFLHLEELVRRKYGAGLSNLQHNWVKEIVKLSELYK